MMANIADIFALTPEEILEHHGVKGQKWGIRNDHTSSTRTTTSKTTTSKLRRKASDVTATQKPGKFVRTVGGKRQLASKDAVDVAASRQFAKKSTTDVLSNKDLQAAIQRMNMEQQFHALVKKTDRRSRRQRITQEFFNKHGDTVIKTISAAAAAAP